MAINKRLLKGAAAGPIVSTDYFNTILYTGNGSTNNITGLDFKPSFVWIKNRDQPDNHRWFDSVRGATKVIGSNSTVNQTTDSDGLTSFDSNGFTTGADARSNTNGEDYVAWCWKANDGTTSSNTDGSITCTVEASPSSGFSVLQWTGTGVVGTLGHGLDSAPELVIIKNLQDVDQWAIGCTEIGWTKYLGFNTNAEALSVARWNNTAPTSSVVTVGPHITTNFINDLMVMYCFHSVSGFSKIGSYTGNGNSSGPSVTTGFEPRFLMIKNVDSVKDWRIMDSLRGNDGSGNIDKHLAPNSNIAENTDTIDRVTFNSNGFTLTTASASWNESGSTFIYLAIA